MKPAHREAQCRLAAMVAAILCATLSGCGTPGAPKPPSLDLPDPVADLSAVRAGSEVTLTWTMPRRNTDKLSLTSNIAVRICRREQAGTCSAAGQVQFAPRASASFTETLPSALATGLPRPLSYFVELVNHNGRSAGLSNGATVLAGEAPSPVTGLAAEVRKDGVVLRWTPNDPDAAIRLQRKLVTPPPAPARTGPLPATPEPLEQNLLVAPAPGTAIKQAIDKNIAFGNTYEYRAQRVLNQTIEGKNVELDGEFSAPIRVEALDVFPPSVPQGLVAVATEQDPAAGAEASIDLSWQPDTEPDLAGYQVYRREDTTPWERLSGDQPVAGPAFHDARVLPGHTYRYAVSAVDKAGHESARSGEASETVPNP